MIAEETNDLIEREKIARELARQITAAHRVDDDLYLEVSATLGAKDIVDVLILAGCYDTVSSLLNDFKGPVPRQRIEVTRVNG